MSDAQESTTGERLREAVAERYAAMASGLIAPDDAGSCCGPTACTPEGNPITTDLYDDEQSSAIPTTAMLASLGCGNPTALVDLHKGDVVLDLGSGGGIDVLLSARRVGPEGKVYGLDMVDEMLELARQNQRESGIENVEFLKGTIEDVPLPDESVDVIISNCVINLSSDKPAVFREAHRVLRPGGRFAVSDVVIRGDLDPTIRHSIEAWIGCVAGALEEGDPNGARGRRVHRRGDRTDPRLHRGGRSGVPRQRRPRPGNGPGCRRPGLLGVRPSHPDLTPPSSSTSMGPRWKSTSRVTSTGVLWRSRDALSTAVRIRTPHTQQAHTC